MIGFPTKLEELFTGIKAGMLACSGDMLLEALVACAGVTLSAVSTAIGLDIKDATVNFSKPKHRLKYLIIDKNQTQTRQ